MQPGITGLAQVNGRNAIGWDAKFELDVWYVDNASIVLDLRILLLTVFRVLRRDGISSDSEVTMPRFLGND
jgi:lipopolysaccharide/colanic/teichoic acid biosynthesis glycosyltransferase